MSGGTGTLLTVGGQYDLSIGRLVSYPVPFSGDGPDLFVSLFGMQTHVSSHGHETSTPTPAAVQRTSPSASSASRRPTACFPGWRLRCAMIAWIQMCDDKRYSFSVLSPRIIFHTGWQSTDQLVLQYSHWFNGAPAPRCGWAIRRWRLLGGSGSRHDFAVRAHVVVRTVARERHIEPRLQRGLLAGLCTLAACIPNAGNQAPAAPTGFCVKPARDLHARSGGEPVDCAAAEAGLEFFLHRLPTSEDPERRHVSPMSIRKAPNGSSASSCTPYTDATAQVYANRDGTQAPVGYHP